MYRALLPPYCPECGEDVPRAAARRCPFCLTPFHLHAQSRPRPVQAVQHEMVWDDES